VNFKQLAQEAYEIGKLRTLTESVYETDPWKVRDDIVDRIKDAATKVENEMGINENLFMYGDTPNQKQTYRKEIIEKLKKLEAISKKLTTSIDGVI